MLNKGFPYGNPLFNIQHKTIEIATFLAFKNTDCVGLSEGNRKHQSGSRTGSLSFHSFSYINS